MPYEVVLYFIYISISSILHPVCKTTLFTYTTTNAAFRGRADLEPSGRIKPVLIPNEWNKRPASYKHLHISFACHVIVHQEWFVCWSHLMPAPEGLCRFHFLSTVSMDKPNPVPDAINCARSLIKGRENVNLDLSKFSFPLSALSVGLGHV